MAELLKDIYDEAFLTGFGQKVLKAYREFDPEGFSASVFNDGWEQLTLKERINHIAAVLGRYLPANYEDALKILFSIDKDCSGFPYLFFPQFVVIYGQGDEHWELSMGALERFTRLSSSEFAIRPFILKDPKRVMKRMKKWAKHPNEHVRRLSSEGCRPRLPWGESLPLFKKDPSQVLSILEQLKEDPSLYVRKSVANNLNDISKDNPLAVIQTAGRWLGANQHTDWIARQGCRTLIKNGNAEALKMFGYAAAGNGALLVQGASIAAKPAKLKIGESCEINYSLSIREGSPVHVRIEYAIDFVKARGKCSHKLFLLSDKTVAGGATIKGTHKHSFADLSTRRHYPGVHRLLLVVNSQEAAAAEIKITEDKK